MLCCHVCVYTCIHVDPYKKSWLNLLLEPGLGLNTSGLRLGRRLGRCWTHYKSDYNVFNVLLSNE